MKNLDLDLTGYLLIPGNIPTNSLYSENVILICTQNSKSTIGIILNKVIDDITLPTLIEQLCIENPNTYYKDIKNIPIHFGGPEEISRGFVIHTNTKQYSNTINITESISLTSSLDILRDMTNGIIPNKLLIAIGMIVFKTSALEAEIANNTWLITKATEDLVFVKNPKRQRETIFNSIGFSSSRLSCFCGNS